MHHVIQCLITDPLKFVWDLLVVIVCCLVLVVLWPFGMFQKHIYAEIERLFNISRSAHPVSDWGIKEICSRWWWFRHLARFEYDNGKVKYWNIHMTRDLDAFYTFQTNNRLTKRNWRASYLVALVYFPISLFVVPLRLLRQTIYNAIYITAIRHEVSKIPNPFLKRWYYIRRLRWLAYDYTSRVEFKPALAEMVLKLDIFSGVKNVSELQTQKDGETS